MDLKMAPKCVTVVTFGGSEVPKNEPEKMKNEGSDRGPILLPSVAPEGTPPAMLLKKLAFGKIASVAAVAIASCLDTKTNA